MTPMKMTSISVSYINMANYSTPLHLKSETVIKFKWPKYELKNLADYVSEFKCLSKLSTGGSYVRILHDLPLRSR